VARGWTGGQYSLLRAGFGVALALAAACEPGPAWLRAAVALAALLLAAGVLSRGTAGAAFVGWATLRGPGWIPGHPWDALVLLALGVHAALPPDPFGSAAARWRADPAGSWTFPAWCGWLAWGGVCALAAFQEAAGATSGALLPGARLVATFAGFFAPVRPFAWLVLCGEEVASTGAHAPLAGLPARLLALALLFEPAWIPARGAERARVYYDGACGLCHRTVRFLLAEDGDGSRFAFGPLASASFARWVPEAERARLPDSVVVRTAEGALRVRSEAVLFLLERLGGLWRVLGAILRVVPRPVRDAAYDGVARVRRRLFRAPEAACPLLPPRLRGRFEDGTAQP
jgi:predicted DCC family thiol-disulfide oxidoreductase YuxK